MMKSKILQILPGTFTLRNLSGRINSSFLLTLLIVVLILNLWSLRISWQKEVIESRIEAVNLSVAQAKQAEDTFMQVEFTLNDVLREIKVQGLANINSPSMRSFLQERYKRQSVLRGLFIFDAQGHWSASSETTDPANANNADRDYFIFHQTNEQKALYIGHVIRSRSSGELVIPVSVRINDQAGKFFGVVVATVRVDYFRQYYSYFELGKQDILSLILADSTVLYARPLPDTFIGKNLSRSPLFTTALNHSDSGSLIWRSEVDGVERLYGFARLHRYPLIVTAGYDKHALWNRWLADHMFSLILNGSLFIMVFAMWITILRQDHANKHNQQQMTTMRDELINVNQTMQTLALLDELTGLANRRQFDLFLEQSLQRSTQNEKPVSLILMNINFFQHANKKIGHENDDRCLQEVSYALRDMPRGDTDFIAHFDSNIFAFILQNTSSSYALDMAMRAVTAVSKRHIPRTSNDIHTSLVTISTGCGTLKGNGRESDAQALINLAEKSLSEAMEKARRQTP